ncbi:MAG TPA: AraC family transcriptional regulator ligand-binding domain-containing protein [Ideonella sp.]|uniref:helix-turn-helix transcriptional regulator n=1 Tax=Ideonella sp. TaxID=1929293 RepID=UPI002E364F34|nr:AraC family transcriptional regulator ligand-binding domain-containing protein [Ideonella sp.]HEX5683094.1 AraC family transcriptional regulator ligand-binding domain-containing protein [Ideonella sp.]
MMLALGGDMQLHLPPAGRCYEADTGFVPAQHHAGLLLEYARQRELSLPEAAGQPAWRERISPRELLNLLVDVVRADRAPDTAFLLGQAWWPGHAGAASHALAHAADLGQALALLVEHSATLSPLLTPRCLLGPRHALVYWLDASGEHAHRNLLVDLHASALVAMARWLSGEHLPWVVCLNRPAPRDGAQLDTHLGSSLRFDCQLDALLIDAQWLQRPWPRGQGMAAEAARRGGQQRDGQPVRGMLAALYDHLLRQLLDAAEDTTLPAPTLERAAAAFATSPATFKRVLARHGTHFQAELDQVRAHLAMHLFHHQGLANDEVARQLGFHDSTNFRRSFKRWTGMTPSLLRAALGAVGL